MFIRLHLSTLHCWWSSPREWETCRSTDLTDWPVQEHTAIDLPLIQRWSYWCTLRPYGLTLEWLPTGGKKVASHLLHPMSCSQNIWGFPYSTGETLSYNSQHQQLIWSIISIWSIIWITSMVHKCYQMLTNVDNHGTYGTPRVWRQNHHLRLTSSMLYAANTSTSQVRARLVLDMMEWNGMIWNDMEWCGMIWNDVEWCGMIWNHAGQSIAHKNSSNI